MVTEMRVPGIGKQRKGRKAPRVSMCPERSPSASPGHAVSSEPAGRDGSMIKWKVPELLASELNLLAN